VPVDDNSAGIKPLFFLTVPEGNAKSRGCSIADAKGNYFQKIAFFGADDPSEPNSIS
jgi:hypothetical protein